MKAGSRIAPGKAMVSNEARLRAVREASLALMRLLNDRGDTRGLLRSLTAFLQKWSGCSAVGVRLRQGDSFPYFETSGFPDDLVEVERGLCSAQTVSGCLCGNVIAGALDPGLACVTPRGSFWCNGTTEFRAGLNEEERRAWTCDRCVVKGFESAAYFPLRHSGETIGLLQVNDRSAGRFTPELLDFLEGAADQIASALAQRMSEDGMRMLAQAVSQVDRGIVIMSAGGTIEYVNAAYERMTGYSAAELVGRPVDGRCAIPVEGGERLRLEESMRAGRTWSGFMYCRRADGTEYVEETTISPVLSPAGEIVRYVAVKHDASVEVETAARLRHLENLESIGRLAAGMSHELNNLLTPILGHAEMLLGSLPPQGSTYDQLREIRRAAKRSEDLVRQLLAFSGQQSASMEPADLGELLCGIEESLRQFLPPSIRLYVRRGPGAARVRVDRGLIEHALFHLVDNGRAAMPDGGDLEIRVRVPDAVELETLRQDSHAPFDPVVLSVADTGIGMSEERQRHLFEPYRSSKSAPGYGRGLPTVWGIVKQHAGTVRVKSARGVGTTVTIYLPKLTEERQRSDRKQLSTEDDGGGRPCSRI